MIAFPDLILLMAIGNSWAKPEKFAISNRGVMDQMRMTFQKPGAEDTEQDLYIRGGNLRIQTQQNPDEIYAAQALPHDHYGGDGYRHHHTVAGKPVLPWLWNPAPTPEWGILLRGKNLYLAARGCCFIRLAGLYYSGHL